MIFRSLQRFVHLIPPEKAHHLAIELLRREIFPFPVLRDYPRLHTNAFGMNFPNPLGLAAGFDKNGEVYAPMLKQGFGFVEVGTVTPLAQEGNPKPRVFRLPEAEAVINRLGFNNQGASNLFQRLPDDRSLLPGIVGINIGKNKRTEEALDDYLPLLRQFYPRASYMTANISSPNTAGLRDLQKRETFEHFARALCRERDGLAALQGVHVPLLIKIAPDMPEEELEHVVGIAMQERLDGLIISNTTISRPASLTHPNRAQQGGLSGAPLMQLSTETLRKAAKLSGGHLPLIGVGGIRNAEDVLTKIRAGATLVQLYTALVYQGLTLPARICQELDVWMERVGLKSLQDIRGMDVR